MTVTITREGSFAIVTVDNPPVNALSKDLRQGLIEAVDTLDADPRVNAVVLLCAGRTFIAGADVSEFGKPPQPPHLPDLVSRLEAAEKPWLAAIHGNALGGGLEIAMGCTYRVALKGSSLGLPEVRLGIVPGAGGTVRLPRIVGARTAVEMVTTGNPISAEKAALAGLVDTVVEGDLKAGAAGFLKAALQEKRPEAVARRSPPQVEKGFWLEAEAAVNARAKGEVAPAKALACVQFACGASFDEAMGYERKTFLELRGSQQALALRHVFFAERAAPRPPELSGLPTRDIRTTAVVGGGTMGAGIAVALRESGLPVVLVERDAEAVQRGLANVRAIVKGMETRKRIDAKTAELWISGVAGSDDYHFIADSDLVIEAVFEDLDVKRGVFLKLSEVCRPDAILATNTSYLNPSLISEGIKHPERFLGLHFFSPAHVMKLLEVVPTDETGQDVLATGFALARRMSKIPVRAGICDGFIGNRLLKVARAQAERLLLAGAAPSAVDSAMRKFGQPMGPFEAQDLGGLDIAAFQRKAARDRGEQPFAPIAERLCAMGRLGQKTGGGWYDYAEGDRKPRRSDVVAGIIAELASDRPQENWDDDMIANAIVLPMINEGAEILAEQVALRPADIDLVQVHGYGFPRWRGGLMHYAEARGLQQAVSVLESLAGRGFAKAPSNSLLQVAAAGNFDGISRSPGR